VTFGGLPVPGAGITATQGEHKVATVTGEDGVFRLPALDEGSWIIRVEMPGFAPVTQEVTIADGTPPSTWQLILLPLDELTHGLKAAVNTGRTAPTTGDSGQRPGTASEPPEDAGTNRPPIASATSPLQAGFQRAQVNPAGAAALGNEPSAAAERIETETTVS